MRVAIPTPSQELYRRFINQAETEAELRKVVQTITGEAGTETINAAMLKKIELVENNRYDKTAKHKKGTRYAR